MLGLKLRDEFLSSQMSGTQIDLSEVVGDAAIDSMLDMTYPTADVRKALRAIATPEGRPVVIIGERGQGKSHILGILHHAFKNPDRVKSESPRVS